MMIKIIKLALASLFGILAIGLVIRTGMDLFSFRYMFGLAEIVFGGSVITTLTLLSFLLFIKTLQSDKYKLICKWSALSLVFIFYCFILTNLLLTSRAYYHLRPGFQGFFERVKYNSNFIPFKTIATMIQGQNSYSYRNLIGNLFLMAPMGFFLPIYTKKLRKLLPFTITVAIGTFIIEVAQAALNVGVLDVDDLILNLLGAVIVFLILHNRFARKLLHTVNSKGSSKRNS